MKKNTDQIISQHFAELGRKSWEVRKKKILAGSKKINKK